MCFPPSTTTMTCGTRMINARAHGVAMLQPTSLVGRSRGQGRGQGNSCQPEPFPSSTAHGVHGIAMVTLPHCPIQQQLPLQLSPLSLRQSLGYAPTQSTRCPRSQHGYHATHPTRAPACQPATGPSQSALTELTAWLCRPCRTVRLAAAFAAALAPTLRRSVGFALNSSTLPRLTAWLG